MNEQVRNILEQSTTKTSKIEQLLRLGLTRREIADLVNMSKTTVHRIISQEKSRENFSQDGSVPCEDAGQEGQSGQVHPLLFKSEMEDSSIFEIDEDFDAL